MPLHAVFPHSYHLWVVFFLSSAQSRSTPHPKLPVSHGVMSLVLRQSLENLQKTWGSRKQISPKASLERTATLAMTPGGNKNSHGRPAPVHRNSEIGNACRSLCLKLQESVEPRVRPVVECFPGLYTKIVLAWGLFKNNRRFHLISLKQTEKSFPVSRHHRFLMVDPDQKMREALTASTRAIGLDWHPFFSEEGGLGTCY